MGESDKASMRASRRLKVFLPATNYFIRGNRTEPGGASPSPKALSGFSSMSVLAWMARDKRGHDGKGPFALSSLGLTRRSRFELWWRESRARSIH